MAHFRIAPFLARSTIGVIKEVNQTILCGALIRGRWIVAFSSRNWGFLDVTKLSRNESNPELKHCCTSSAQTDQMSTISRAFNRRMLAIAFIALWSPALQAQDILRPHTVKPPADRSWRLIPGLRIVETFDDNPFLLSDARKAGVDAPSASSITSGRYTSMAGASDYITSVRGGLSAEGPAILGRKLTLGADARYEYYQKNDKRRNMFYDLRAVQALGRGAYLAARAELQPKYFFRNYLADAIDASGDGIIQTAERVYAAGTYSDQEFTGELRQRLVKSTDDHPFGAELTLEAGHKARSYQQPFQTRGYRGPFAGISGDLDLTASVGLEGEYRRSSLRSTPGTSVLLLNEPDFNRDFNGNGTTTDLRVRSLQGVDFSRIEQDMAARFRVRPNGAIETTLSYGRRMRSYQSKQPFDVYNNTRRDHRDRIGLDMAYRFSPGRSVHFGGNGEVQKLTNTLRPTATIDDAADYTRKGFYVSWSHQL
jgi:hypothetical protein